MYVKHIPVKTKAKLLFKRFYLTQGEGEHKQGRIAEQEKEAAPPPPQRREPCSRFNTRTLGPGRQLIEPPRCPRS